MVVTGYRRATDEYTYRSQRSIESFGGRRGKLMSAEELENYETDAQLALYREYQDVMSLFSYAVETDRRFYLANKVDVTPQIREGTIYFEVVMNDVWVWDVFRTNRFVKNVRAFSTRDVNVEERLPNQDFTVPEIADLPDDLG
jgi:putative CTP synthase (UTP-ammonia lyase)